MTFNAVIVVLSRLAVVVMCVVGAAVHAAQSYQISEIIFEGNEKTRSSTLLQEMGFKAGQTVDDAMLEMARQSIMDLSLFKSVKFKLADNTVDEGKILTITVSEKRYFFVLPSLNRSGDGDISYGAQLEYDNLLGLNQQLEVKARRKDFKSADVDNEKQFSIEYLSPRIWGSHYDFEVDLDLVNSLLEEERGTLAGDYDRDLVRLRLKASRWLKNVGPSKGWRVNAGISREEYEHTFLGGDPDLFFDADILSFALGLEFIDVHDYLYSREGQRYGGFVDIASEDFGSDRSFTKTIVYYRKYNRISDTPHTNLNLQVRAGFANRTIFGDPAFSSGGSSSLRGYDREDIEGDAFYVANIEYLRPIFGKRTLRGVVFMDMGNAYPEASDFDPFDVEFGVGFGLRWKLKSFVRTDIRIDYAKGLGDFGTDKFYASTKATF